MRLGYKRPAISAAMPPMTMTPAAPPNRFSAIALEMMNGRHRLGPFGEHQKIVKLVAMQTATMA